MRRVPYIHRLKTVVLRRFPDESGALRRDAVRRGAQRSAAERGAASIT